MDLLKNRFSAILLIIILSLTISCGFKEDESEDNEIVSTIKEINRIIISDNSREADRTPYVSRSYNYAGLDYDGYISTLSYKSIVDALFEELDNENIKLVSYNISIVEEDIVEDGVYVIDNVTVGISLRGLIQLNEFMGLNLPANTVFTGTITSKRQLDFIQDLDGLWRFVAERNVFTEIDVNGGESVEFHELFINPVYQISIGDDLLLTGRVKRGNSYLIQVDWGYNESGSDELVEGTSFEKTYNFISPNDMMPPGRDSIFVQVAGCNVSLDLITGFQVKVLQIPVLPLYSDTL